MQLGSSAKILISNVSIMPVYRSIDAFIHDAGLHIPLVNLNGPLFQASGRPLAEATQACVAGGYFVDDAAIEAGGDVDFYKIANNPRRGQPPGGNEGCPSMPWRGRHPSLQLCCNTRFDNINL